mgnify:CR=1 FL=1|tara:strand:- start:1829 stop:2203 length:375 start_codon:yes stop_codon:yes gene_type:complete
MAKIKNFRTLISQTRMLNLNKIRKLIPKPIIKLAACTTLRNSDPISQFNSPTKANEGVDQGKESNTKPSTTTSNAEYQLNPSVFTILNKIINEVGILQPIKNVFVFEKFLIKALPYIAIIKGEC